MDDDFKVGVIVGVIASTILITAIYCAIVSNHYIKVDNKESLNEISRKPTKPDTLLGHKTKNTYYFELLTSK